MSCITDRIVHVENGKIEVETYYKKDLKDGTVKWWYNDGKLRMTGFYKNNLQDSTWRYYKPTGDIDYIDNYEKDIKVNKKTILNRIQFIPL